jgi:hypothetical protein
MKLKRNVSSAGGSGTLPSALPTCKLSERFPTVAEFLTSTAWEDGSSRSTGTITLMRDEGAWKAALHDRDAGLSCFVSGKTFTALLEAMERGLEAGSLEWREKKDYGSGRAGKRA